MRFVDVPDLFTISEHIAALSANGLSIRCRLELYSCKKAPDAASAAALNAAQAGWGEHSAGGVQGGPEALGTLGSIGSAAQAAFPPGVLDSQAYSQLLAKMCEVLCEAYPFFDFTLIPPSKYFTISFDSAHKVIDNTLASTLADSLALRQALWVAITDICPPAVGRVFTLECAPYAPFEEQDGVWSQNFVFYNTERDSILLLVLRAVPAEGADDEDAWADEDAGMQPFYYEDEATREYHAVQSAKRRDVQTDEYIGNYDTDDNVSSQRYDTSQSERLDAGAQRLLLDF